jgi:hypothetical protein
MFSSGDSSSWKGPAINTVAGTLFGIAWWLVIDAIVYNNSIDDPNPVKFEYVLPGIFATFGLIM